MFLSLSFFSDIPPLPRLASRKWFITLALLFFGTLLSGDGSGVKAAALQEDALKTKTTKQASQNPYLKEILIGRCYENPPNQSPQGGAQLCPVLVPSFLNVLEGQLDQNIDPDAYYMYLGWTKYDLPKDSAIFVWPPPPTTTAITSTTRAAADWMLPETTPSGSLVQGLVFCGTDRRMDCPGTEFWKDDVPNGAMVSFWKAIYSDFTSKAQGQIKMLLLQNDMDSIPNFWNDSILANLDSQAVTRVDIILTSNCNSPGVSILMEAIQSKNIETRCIRVDINNANSPEEGIGSGSIAQSCEIADILNTMDHDHDHDSLPETEGTTTSNDDSNNHHGINPTKELQPSATPPANSSSVNCQCPTSVYTYLFWFLVLVVAAAAYAIWSVWHYLPAYQRIPNVENGIVEANGHGAVLPKQ